MRLKDLLKEGPLKFLVEHDGPNRSKRRSVAAKVKASPKLKLTTAQKRKRRKRIKHGRLQGVGLRKA